MNLELGGCNTKLKGDWIRINHKERGHYDVAVDINTDVLPWGNDTFDMIYASMVFEHIPLEILHEHVINEIYRVLKPQGILRVIVPDMEAFAHSYINGEIHPFTTNRIITISPLRRHLGLGASFVGTILSNGDDTYLYARNKEEVLCGCAHVNGFDYTSLSRLLKMHGFSNVERSLYRNDVDDNRYDNKWCLFVEATK